MGRLDKLRRCLLSLSTVLSGHIVTSGPPDRLVIPAVVVHPSSSFRHGLGAALDPRRFRSEDPENLDVWLGLDGRRLAIVANGAELAMLANRRATTTLVVLVPTLEIDLYKRALAIGADGVAHIDAHPSTIAHVALGAVNGEVIIPAEVARQLAGRPRPAALDLSSEDRLLLQRLSDGATIVQLGEEMYLAERSVRRRLQNIYIRLEVSGRAEALKRAVQLGLVN